MQIVGYTRPDTNIASVKAQGAYTVQINLTRSTVSTLAAHLVAGSETFDQMCRGITYYR